MDKAWWWALFAWLMVMASHHTWLKGIPGVEPLSVLLLIGCLSWIFAGWTVDRFFKNDS